MRQKDFSSSIIKIVLRVILFTLTLSIGTLISLTVDESAGLASLDLSDASVEAISPLLTNYHTLYTSLSAGNQSAGIYRSPDNGRTWEYVSPGLGVAVNVLAVNPVDDNVLYAGTAGGSFYTTDNLWSSVDGGKEWHRFYLRLPANTDGSLPTITSLVVDPVNPDKLYVGTAGQGIYRYSIQPDVYEYELVGGSLSGDTYVQSMIIDNQSRLYALTTRGLLVLDPNQNIWRKIYTIPDLAVSLAIDPVDPNNLYIGTSAYGAYHSVDGGKTWMMINQGLEWQPGRLVRVSAIAIDQNNPQHLSLATAYQVGNMVAGDGVYQSFDGGQSWQKLADTKAVISKIGIVDGQVYTVSAAGLINYSDSVIVPENSVFVQLQRLANPNGSQILILIFTVIMGGLLAFAPTPVLHYPQINGR